MKPKGLLIAVVLLAVLGGLWWWSNKKQEADSKKPAAATTTMVLTIPEDQFQEIRFKRGVETVTLRRDNGKWRITQPQPYPADPDAARALVTSLSSLMAETAIELGVKDFVLPGTKPEIVKRFAGGSLSSLKDASIMMPGIGSQGGSLNIAFRAALPHRRFAIIGSAIYAAKEPRSALENFIQEIHHE